MDTLKNHSTLLTLTSCSSVVLGLQENTRQSERRKKKKKGKTVCGQLCEFSKAPPVEGTTVIPLVTDFSHTHTQVFSVLSFEKELKKKRERNKNSHE